MLAHGSNAAMKPRRICYGGGSETCTQGYCCKVKSNEGQGLLEASAAQNIDDLDKSSF